MKIIIRILSISILLICFVPIVTAQLKIEVISLQNRTADQIIPIIKPLVSEGGTVTGMNNQLIIKTTAANLAEIKKILRSLDISPRRLMITVRQDIDGTTLRNQTSLNGSYSTGNVIVSNANHASGKTGAGLTSKDDKGNVVRFRTINTGSRLADTNDFRVQTIEGQPAYIQTGKSVPVANQNTIVTQGRVVVQDTIEYRDVTSGFYVVANLNGNNVTLLISPNMSRTHPHQGAVIDVQNIETTVRGRLGEWIRIGGVERQTNRENRSVFISTRRQNHETRTVLIKVDEIK